MKHRNSATHKAEMAARKQRRSERRARPVWDRSKYPPATLRAIRAEKVNFLGEARR